MIRKIISLLLTFFLVFLLASCNKEKPKLVINYFDGDNLIQSKEYLDSIDHFYYIKDDYIFDGWFLDKELTSPFDEVNNKQYFKLKSINLYAKLEHNMKDLNIQIKGNINETEVVLNPAFIWNGDANTSYNVSLISNEEVIEEIEANNGFFQVSNLLKPNTLYILIVSRIGEDTKNSITFKTISNYNNVNYSIVLVNPYSNGMVIQRDIENTISGSAPANQLITLSIGDEKYYTISSSSGHFDITLPAKEASFTPVDIIISNGIDCSRTISDVLFGDVYLFAGQSNMQWLTRDSDYTSDDINKLENSYVRFFCQDVTTSTQKKTLVKNGRWFKPNMNSCSNFSAIATITGAILSDLIKNETPIGIITAYQGDTNIANWMGPEYYDGACLTKSLHYNAMVYPLKAAHLKGVVWYQGCNNSSNGCEYKDLLLKLFENYRDLFNNQGLVFFVIGLACYDGDSGNNFDFSYVRESQALACKQDSNAYFISTCDDGDPTYIHPKAKHYISERVAKSMASVFYSSECYSEGPSYKSHIVSGNTVTISLNNADGLTCSGEIDGLYLAGADGKYYKAKATIINNQIVASCEKVNNPCYIKYGFGKSPFVNIFNKDGFAITPFRTDNYNTNIDLFDYEATDNYYFHPDGSNMQISIKNNNLVITKENDGKGFGSIRLDKWGAIAYKPESFAFTIIGNNSNATISIRFVEGDSYEIWGYKIIDDFEGAKTFKIDCSELSVMYNKQNDVFEPQKISYVEIMIECNGNASFELVEARFIDKN